MTVITTMFATFVIGFGVGWFVRKLYDPLEIASIRQEAIDAIDESNRYSIDASSCRSAMKRMSDQFEAMEESLSRYREIALQLSHVEMESL